MTELTTKSSGTYLTPLKTILVVLVFFLVIIGITEAQISSEVKISNGEKGESYINGNYSGKSYNWSWNWTFNGYNQPAEYVVVGGGGGGSIYNIAAENASTVVTPAATSQVVETPSGALANINGEIADLFGATATMMKIMVLGIVVITTISMLRWLRAPHVSNTDEEETTHHGSDSPQTVVSNTPHYYPIPDTSPVKYDPPKPKKPIVDRDGVEDDDSSFIEVLD